MAAPFYFVRWLVPGQEPRGSRTLATLRACRSFARRGQYAHPSWVAQVVRHEGGEQTVVEEVR